MSASSDESYSLEQAKENLIIDQHYDVRNEEDKMRQRQEVLEEVQMGESSYV